MGPQKPMYYLFSLPWKGLQLSGGWETRRANKGFRCGSKMRGTVLAIEQHARGISKSERWGQLRESGSSQGRLYFSLSPRCQRCFERFPRRMWWRYESDSLKNLIWFASLLWVLARIFLNPLKDDDIVDMCLLYSSLYLHILKISITCKAVITTVSVCESVLPFLPQ